MGYYLLDEDPEAAGKIFLGPLDLDERERHWMIRGEIRFIPDMPLHIPVKYAPADGRTDFLNRKIPLVSNDLKSLFEQKVGGGIYYREAILHDRAAAYLYFYLAPPLCDCFDFRNSDIIADPRMPGGMRIRGGFCLRPGPVGKLDIFRVAGLSGRRIIISGRLKKICEAQGVKGVKFVRTEDYRDPA